MAKNKEEEITRDEIKKEFQLERMILFSDAVFAIVITLMAIEIRLPDTTGKLTVRELLHEILLLLPVLFAYMVSFMFIGAIWYQHLQIFGLLKSYDKGLVIRNLVLLFGVGLFPFSATLITKFKGNLVAVFIYMSIIFFCIVSQYILYHYIIVKRPELRLDVDISNHETELYNRKLSLICFSGAGLLIAVTYIIIDDPNWQPLSSLWMMAFPLVYRKLKKKTAT